MFELVQGVYSVGVQNPGLRIFDIIMKTPYGTSYNAYLVKGESKSALVETSKDGFLDEYLNNISQVMPFERIDYLVINHTEPDHVGVIPELIKRNPNLEVIGTNSAITFIGQIINRPFNSRVVKKGDTLDLGGRTLSFYPMPNLHWPDTMFTQDSLTNALFTCDFLGAHYSFAPMLFSRVKDQEEYLQATRQYFMDIMSPFAHPFVINGIAAVKELNPSMVLPGHGAVLDKQIDKVLGLYGALSQKPARDGKQAAIIYVSAYGYTRMLAQTIHAQLLSLGLNADMIELSEDNQPQALAAISQADGVLFGSPTFLGDTLQPIGELLAALHPYNLKGKLCAAFGSYGWSGEAVGNITGRLEQLKAKTLPGVRARLKPSEQELEQARALAREFAAGL